MPCYLKSHSMGEYVFDHGWAEALERAGGRYYPKLQAAVPFTPVTGRRLLIANGCDAELHRRLLANAGEALTNATGASSLHVTFATESDWQVLTDAGYLARTDQQYHFVNEGYRDFDDFLEALASRKRKAIRRERRDALDGLEVVHRTGREITEQDWDAFFRFYMDTGSRKWGKPYLNRRFFSLIGERMADRILLIFATRNGKPIAGALNFIGSETLYGRYWGTTAEQPFLHFELCYYQAIEWGIAHGMKSVEAGAQGEHKVARGYRPTTTLLGALDRRSRLPQGGRRLPEARAPAGRTRRRGAGGVPALPPRRARGLSVFPCRTRRRSGIIRPIHRRAKRCRPPTIPPTFSARFSAAKSPRSASTRTTPPSRSWM